MAYVPTVVVGRYAPFGIAGVYHATICMPWAFIVALWHVEDPTMGADLCPQRRELGRRVEPRRFEAATLTCKGFRGADQFCSMGLTAALEATERPDPPGE